MPRPQKSLYGVRTLKNIALDVAGTIAEAPPARPIDRELRNMGLTLAGCLMDEKRLTEDEFFVAFAKGALHEASLRFATRAPLH